MLNLQTNPKPQPAGKRIKHYPTKPIGGVEIESIQTKSKHKTESLGRQIKSNNKTQQPAS